MFSLDIKKSNGSILASKIGGGAFVNEDFDWPLTAAGRKMTPLMTIRQDIFLLPTIPVGMCVTVFSPYDKNSVSISAYRMCAKNDISQNPTGMKVIIHNDSEKEVFIEDGEYYPSFDLIRRQFSEEEQEEDLKDEINGLYLSKVLGRPSWLQDEIFLPEKYFFAIQISENDLTISNQSYEGIFSDGSCYLYLNRALKKIRSGGLAGECFIQFT